MHLVAQAAGIHRGHDVFHHDALPGRCIGTAAHRIDRAARRERGAQAGLHQSQHGFIFPVNALGLPRFRARLEEQGTAHQPDLRVAKVANQLSQRIWREHGAAVGKHEQVMPGALQGHIQSCGLSTAFRLNHDVDARVGDFAQHGVGPVAGTIGNDHDLQFVSRVVQGRDVADLFLQMFFFIVGGDQHRQRRKLFRGPVAAAAVAAVHQVTQVAQHL